jgi:DNA uptake protein ComE-like DNA-binding protein
MKISVPATLAVVVFLFLATPLAALADGVIDANSATEEQLAALPGMNSELVAAVISNRPFATIGELNNILSASLDEEQREELYGALFVPIKLNSAADSDMLLIPGVGKRMAHEFEEYRPYTNMEQFRREIGKYVDAAEVARLEQYVTLD